MSELTKSSSMEYKKGEVDESSYIQIPPVDPTTGIPFPVVIAKYSSFSNLVIPNGIVYIDVSTNTVYIGDGATLGGVVMTNIDDFDGIDGGKGLNPVY
jgi:hypothetical protein